MKKVLIVCPYPHGRAPSQRFRFEQYLNLVGVEFTQVSFWRDDEWPRIYEDGSIKYKVLRTIGGFWRRLLLLSQVRNFDKVFVHREATPIGPPWFEWAVVKLFKKHLLLDFDDAIWLPNSSKANEKLAGKLKFHGKTAKICSWATTCSVGNAFLADYAKQFCNDVRIIPTTIDTEHHHNPALYEKVGSKWVRKAQQQFTESSSTEDELIGSPEKIPQNSGTANSQRLTANLNANDQSSEAHPNTQYSIPNTLTTIGWTGTHSTLKQLTPLFPLLQELHKKHPFRFILIADIPPATIPHFVEFRKWKKETEIEDLLEMDIGVMPLYDTDWERGKCGFKALQYMALGLPVVVSQVGVNASIVKEGLNGFLCEAAPFDHYSKWTDALHKLLENDNLRNQLGISGRKNIEDAYSVKAQREHYAGLILAN